MAAPTIPRGTPSLSVVPHLPGLFPLPHWTIIVFFPTVILPGPKEGEAPLVPSNATLAIAQSSSPSITPTASLFQAGVQREGL